MSFSDDESFFDYEECEDETPTQEALEALQQENELLKAKFEKAIELSQKVKDLQEQNTELQAQVKDGIREKEEMIHRLELANRSIKEGENQLAKQKRVANEQLEELSKQYNAKIAEQKKNSDSEIQYLTEQVNQLLTAAENDEVQKKTEKAFIGRILQAAKRYFNEEISSLDDLYNALNKEPAKPETIIPQPQPETKPKPEVDETKLNKYKQALKDANAQISSLNQQLAEVQKNLRETKRQSEFKINNLNTELQDNQQRFKESEEKSLAKIQNLEGRLNNMKTEVSKARAVPMELMESGRNISASPISSQLHIDVNPEPRKVTIITPNSPPSSPSSQKESMMQSVDMFKDKISHLEGELNAANENIRKKDLALNAATQELSQIRVSAKNNEVELSSLKAVHEETVHELETIRESLHARQNIIEESQHQIDEQKEEDAKRRKRMEVAKKKLQQYKTQVQQLQDENSQLEEKFDEQRRAMTNLNDTKEQLEKKLKDATQELAEAQHKIKTTKIPTADDLVPPHVFAMKGAEDKLAAQIQKIAYNSALQIPSKLQAIYQAIADSFQSKIDEADKQVNDYIETMEKNRQAINQLLVDSSIIVTGKAITYDEYFKDPAVQKNYLQTIQKLREDVDNIKYENDKLQSFTNLYQECFGSSTELLVHATELKNKFTEKDNKIAKQRENIHKLKEAMKELADTTEQTLIEKSDEISELKGQRDELQSRINHIEYKYKSAKEDMNQLEVALMAEKTERENFENMMQENHSRMIGEIDNNQLKQKEEHEVEMKQLKDEIENRKLKMDDLRGELERTKQQLRIMTQKFETMKKALQQETEKYDNDKKVAQQEHDNEKEFMKKTFQNSLDELRKQCDKHREDVKMLSQRLNEEEIEKNDIKQKLQQLTKDKTKLKKCIKTIKEDNERQIKLTMIEARNKVNAMEGPMQKKIEDERQKGEAAKKQIFAFINDNLGDYADSQIVDDLSFRSGVQKIKTVLGKMTVSDETVRRLVQAREGQDTADAVAQMFI